MLENHTYLFQITFTVAPGDEDLDAHRKTHCQRSEYVIEQACHHRRSQFYSAQMPQESRVGKSDDSLCQIAQHNGIGNTPYFAIGDRGF